MGLWGVKLGRGSGLWCMHMENQFFPSLPHAVSSSPVSTLVWCPLPLSRTGFVSLQSSLTPPDTWVGVVCSGTPDPSCASYRCGQDGKKMDLLPPAINARPSLRWASCLSLHLGTVLPNTSKTLNSWPDYNQGPCWSSAQWEVLAWGTGMLWGHKLILFQDKATHTRSLWLH